MPRKAVIAISAIPNSGKTTLFNRLTGASQRVGNWPGVTVEKKVGAFRLDGVEAELVDLPGAYSITPSTIEERVVRDFFLESPPSLILNVVDAGNLYRGLGLTLQLASMDIPMVVAVNMMDEARKKGIEIDMEALSGHLGAPAVPIVARTGEGLDELKKTILSTLEGERTARPIHISFPPALEEAVARIARSVESGGGPELDSGFIAVSLLEDEEGGARLAQKSPRLAEAASLAAEERGRVEKALGQDLVTTCARCRFNSVRGLLVETTMSPARVPASVTEKIDNVLMGGWLGLPLFFIIMFAIFHGVFTLGTPLQEWTAAGVGVVQGWAGSALDAIGAPGILKSFLVDGLIEGVGVVASFFPIIALFFVFLSLIEDTGYMARVAFLVDRLMHMLRLDGKAFISLLLGYGCNVPAIMGTRVLASRHNRLLTMLLIPLTLCSARLQVFLFLAGLLFAPWAAPWAVFSLYILSFAMIILVGMLLRPFSFGTPEPFIMELPPYRLPLARTVAIRAWQEIREFLYRASTMIVSGVVVVWFLTHFPPGAPPAGEETLAGMLGAAAAPVFDPIGIPWRETVALFFGFVAKEVVIGALAVIHGGTDPEVISSYITPLQGMSFMVFTLLYTPCVATLASIRAESGSWKITGLSVALGLVLAWTASLVVYQGGRLLGFE